MKRRRSPTSRDELILFLLQALNEWKAKKKIGMWGSPSPFCSELVLHFSLSVSLMVLCPFVPSQTVCSCTCDSRKNKWAEQRVESRAGQRVADGTLLLSLKGSFRHQPRNKESHRILCWLSLEMIKNVVFYFKGTALENGTLWNQPSLRFSRDGKGSDYSIQTCKIVTIWWSSLTKQLFS